MGNLNQNRAYPFGSALTQRYALYLCLILLKAKKEAATSFSELLLAS